MAAIAGIYARVGKRTFWLLAKAFRKSSGPSCPFLCQNSIQYLLLAFFAGVLLTLLLLALIFFVIKNYRKRKWSLRDGTALTAQPLRTDVALRGSRTQGAHPVCRLRT